MDCHKPLILALGLLGMAGCVPQNSVQPNGPQNLPPVVEKAKDGPVRPPKPSSSVAMGDFFADGASKAPQGSAQQGQACETARKEYQNALAVDPNCVPAYLGLGRLFTNMRDYNEAMKWYRQGLAKVTREGSLWSNLGMCLARQKDWPHAIEAMQRATECDPNNMHYFGTLGFCLAKAVQIYPALVAFQRSYGETRAHFYLARILYETHRDAEARQHAQIVVQAEPTFEPARILLAQLEGHEPADRGVMPAGFDPSAEAAESPR